ncbi:putative hypothetical protein [Methanococcus vannielii SB]|jgi:GTPase SAR1 family protein|uniref:Uncharacterized protein n=1 Tax=Methanococcus vannielii (strain ATCC 35089 / DSM 1224 / JCM 13029 / OCM 148 / SB) TaxID=406327 RepID=A6UP39_METVS|nr:hypothetical protein [Methanococcus vannielii]ABR54261.1 putative hypothetical protein [Methanococcus vannielii SB]
MKNTIERSFEIKDYRIDETDFGDFWMNFENKEKLSVKITYIPKEKSKFTKNDVNRIISCIIEKSKYFKENLPKNIGVNVLFKNLGEKCFKPEENEIKDLEIKEMDEISVMFYFTVLYHI